METSSQPPAPPIPPGFEDFRTKMEVMLNEVTKRAHEAGFRKGWKAAIDAIGKGIENLGKSDIPADADIEEIQVVVKIDRTIKSESQSASVSEVVLRLLRVRPGLTGAELVQFADESGTPLHERSIRTALRRLRISGGIVQKEGKWFVQP